MAVFGVLVDPGLEVLDFVAKTNHRLEDSNLVKNPFKGGIKTVLHDGRLLCVVSMRPVYFNFTVFGWLLAASVFFIWGVSWWILPGVILGSLGIFWHKSFFLFMMKKGMRKAGYTGQFKEINANTIIEYAIIKG